MISAFKIKDGLFLGDETAASDLTFIVANKVSYILNCASRQVPNHWEPIGLKYVNFAWLDNDSQIILDSGDKNVALVHKFVEEALSQGQSVLVHSIKGKSRSACIITAYLMHSLRWSFNKSLEFMRFRRPDVDIKKGFLNQLQNFEKRLLKKGPLSYNWTDSCQSLEEIMLANTWLNCQVTLNDSQEQIEEKKSTGNKLRWLDETQGTLISLPSNRSIENISAKSLLKQNFKQMQNSEYKLALRPSKSAVNIFTRRKFSTRSLRQSNSKRKIFR